MNAIEVAKRYLDAWNRHDADALVALFADGGTYHNPDLAQPLSGKDIGAFARQVWTTFPDASWELISIGDTGGGLVASQWLGRGTNTGPLADGRPPTGRPIAHPGASFTQVEGDQIRSDHVYHDRQSLAEELGLEAAREITGLGRGT